MESVTVNFLGKEYQISQSVKDFLQYDEILTPVRVKILKKLSENIKYDAHFLTFRNSTVDHIRETTEEYQNLLRECAKVLIRKLVELGIYDVTVDELMSNSTAISELHDLCMYTLENLVEEGNRYVEMKQEGMEKAYRSAASQITGSGLSIFSNSITTLLLHSVVESGILMSQAKQADKEYYEAVEAINANTSDDLGKMLRETMVKCYYPSVLDILVKFNLSITSEFFKALVLHDKFDFDSVERYNMEKAGQMLKNISLVPNVPVFLQQVFEICPFCYELYETCLKKGILDEDTFNTAKYFGFADKLSVAMYKYIELNSNNIEAVSSVIPILAMHKHTTDINIWRKLYKDTVHRIETRYKKYHMAISNSSDLDRFVRKNINNRMSDIVNMSIDMVEFDVHGIVSSTMTKVQFETFTSLGLISLQNIRLADSNATDIEEINDEISEKLVAAVMSYVDEARRRLELYEQSKAQFNHEIAIMRDELNHLKSEREHLGFFAFSKKKELASLIEEQNRRIADFERSHESINLLADFEKMYR